MKKHLYTQTVIVLLLLTDLVYAGKEIKLAYNLQQGQKYSLEIKNNQTISMTMSGQSMVLKQHMEMIQDVLVKEVNEQNHQQLDLTYSRIVFKQNAMGMEVSWDSQNPDTTNALNMQIGQAMSKMIGTPTEIVIDEKGNPLSLNKAGNAAQSANLAGFESGMMVVYPSEVLKTGDKWSTKLQPDPKSDFVIESSYTLDEIKGKTAVISFNGTISGSQIMGEKAVISGTISGTSEVDIKTGWLLNAAVNQKLEMEMEQQGMSIPMQMSSFIEIKTK